MMQRFIRRNQWLLAMLLVFSALLAPAQSKKPPVVAKWGRFEQAFKSSAAYTNAPQEATLWVTFISPLGETNQVEGFWDGGKNWRVRFAPNQVGRWTYTTACSDAANQGLHNKTGEFTCSAATGASRFNQHGPVQVARDRRHFEHADGTPFYWLADTAWNVARQADPKDWETYANIRGSQNFTAVQWVLAPGEDVRKQTAYVGPPDHVVINPEFFKRLEAKLEVLSRAGLLSAIVPLSELSSQWDVALMLPEDQAALLVRYVVARLGAEPVVWLLAFDGDEKKAARWNYIGQAAFSGLHAPVILYPGERPALLDQFRQAKWVDGFAVRLVSELTEDDLKQSFTGSLSKEWTREPARPIVGVLPCENGAAGLSGNRFSAEDVRRAAYWSTLSAPPVGLSYCADGVVNWDTTRPAVAGDRASALPLWHRTLFLPGAKQISALAGFLAGMEYWRLQPSAGLVSPQPGELSPRRYTLGAVTAAKDLSLVYVPEDRTLEVVLDAMPSAPAITWFNPRTGENSPAVAVVSTRTCQFPTPDPGDWLLVLKAGK